MRLALLAWIALLPAASGPSISYFARTREVKLSSSERQAYVVVDEEIWNQARPDLGDARFYDGDTQVPYALNEQRGGMSSEEQPAKILNLGSAHGLTEFDLDVGAITEYNRVRLAIGAKDYLVNAIVEGRDSPGAKGTEFNPVTLFDFSREKLGSNNILRLPDSSFRYLHVRLSRGIRPEDIKSAAVFQMRERKAAWTPIRSSLSHPVINARRMTVEWTIPEKIPVDRVHFTVAEEEVNFRRSVTITDASGAQVGGGELSRVRVTRRGIKAVSENLDIDLPGARTRGLTVTIDNGDDPPLRALGMQLLSIERRLYFDPRGKPKLTLYYGDAMLESPVYDYAKFFTPQENAVAAEMEIGEPNPAYSGRPDDRPWSERHRVVMWAALLAAITTLAVIAIRGLKAAQPRWLECVLSSRPILLKDHKIAMRYCEQLTIWHKGPDATWCHPRLKCPLFAYR
jgi:uncharacterized protein DUF3999